MVKKYVMEITGDVVREPDQKEPNVDFLLSLNKTLHEKITKYKNKITEYYKNKLWDRYKKISNEYEMIFTTPNTGANVSQYIPVSRSFFKMWEMLYDFKEELGIGEEGAKKYLFLAEGPGGFAEAVIKYRRDNNLSESDEYHGMTLKSNNNKNIPEWKMGNGALKQVKIHYGADDTGNLYNMANIVHLTNKIGKHSVEVITADGGFDFSSDFNNQEEMSMHLIFCEILTALLCQKEGGHFILKIYDIFNDSTIKMIHILRTFYKKVYIVKPLTSRPANSEKYLVCIGFNHTESHEKKKKYYEMLYKYVLFPESRNMCFDDIHVDRNILHNIVLYNNYSIMRQVYYIQGTIDFINMTRRSLDSKGMTQRILQEHERKSRKWCEKYEVNAM